VQREPALTLKQTANLLSHLYGLNPGHPEKWLEIMSRVTNLLDNHPQLSQTGLVGAWMSGLAHYRDSAMKQLAMLPEALAKGLLGLPVDRDFQVFLDELRRNRWLTAQSPADAKPASIHRIETRVGACALLGGDFPVPPEVVGGDGQFFVRSGELVWQMHVDAFGSSLIPCDPEGLKHHEIATERADKSLLQSLLADISDISSSVHLADTLALTSRETFAVIVLSVAVVQSGGAA